MIKLLKNKIKNKFFYKIENYFNTKYDNNVLISYITYPFKKGVRYTHSNYVEAIKIAKVFKELGYNVDIYNYNYNGKLDIKKYDIIFGMGSLFESLVKNRDKKRIYIYYATGAYFAWANYAEIERIKKLFLRKGKILQPKRFIKHPTYFATQCSDAIITTGNEWTVSTYRKFIKDVPIYKVPVSVYDIIWKDNIKRDISKIKRNFLWFGSSGLVHKGLDLCIEVFKDIKDYNLYICGLKEEDFFEVYNKELKLNNIYYKGFINIQSDKFREIVENCCFAIFPSCSEGGGGSLLTAMGTGLIPIATKESSVNLEFGFEITDEIEKIKEKIIGASNLEDEKLLKLSKKNMEFVKQNHNIEKFKEIFKENLLKILKENKNG